MWAHVTACVTFQAIVWHRYMNIISPESWHWWRLFNKLSEIICFVILVKVYVAKKLFILIIYRVAYIKQYVKHWNISVRMLLACFIYHYKHLSTVTLVEVIDYDIWINCLLCNNVWMLLASIIFNNHMYCSCRIYLYLYCYVIFFYKLVMAKILRSLL